MSSIWQGKSLLLKIPGGDLMSASIKNSIKKITTKNTDKMKAANDREADVLFQKIYDKWYAFSVVEDECLMTEVPASEVQKRKKLPSAA
jgi:hypothetical protein